MNNRKKVLFIIISFDGNNQRTIRQEKVIEYLSMSYKVDVIDVHKKCCKKCWLFNTNNKFVFISLIKKIIIKLLIFPDKYTVLYRRYQKEIEKKIQVDKFNQVIINVFPISLLKLAKFIKQLNPKISITVDLSDPISANSSYIISHPFMKMYLEYYEKKYLKYIDKLIVLNNEIKFYYKEKYPKLNFVEVIEMGIDEKIFHSPNNFVNDYGNGPIELIYGGIFYADLREPYELYKAIQNCSLNIRLSIYGNIKKKFKPPRANKFFYGGRINKRDLFDKYFSADIIVFIDNFYGIQVPGKLFEVLAFNKPILFITNNKYSPSISYAKDFISVYITDNEYENIQCAINKIIKENDTHIYRDLSNYYWKNLLSKYLTILEKEN